MTEGFAPVFRLAHGVKDRHRGVEALAALPRRHPGDDVGAVGYHLPGVEGAVAAGDPLHHEAGVPVHEHAHAASLASATACFTASSMSERARIPAPCRSGNACSSLVPVSRMTMGRSTLNSAVAVTMPLATSSDRKS